MELTDSQNISLHDALTFVPRFKGDSDELIDFISCCQDAKQIMPEAAEANLAKLIYLAKLSSNVKLSLNHVIPITIEGLVKALKRIYVSSKSIYQLQEVFTQNLNNEIDERMPICDNIEEALTNAIRIERKLKMRREIRNGTKTSNVKNRTIGNFENFTNTTEACQICDSIGHTAKECPQIIQSNIYREIVNTEKVTDNFRELDSDTGYETSTSESGKSIENLEVQTVEIVQKVIDRFTEPAVEVQNAFLQKKEPAAETPKTSLQEKESVIEVRKTSLQKNDVTDAPKTRRGRPRKHRVKFKERRISPHEVTPLLDPDVNSEFDSSIGEDSSSESDGLIEDINEPTKKGTVKSNNTVTKDLLEKNDNTIRFSYKNRQPDDEGLQIQKLSDTRLKSRFTNTRQVYWTKRTNTNNFDLKIHELGARSKTGKLTVKLKGLFKRVLTPAAMAA
ncbi:Protein of unknown function [Cotesia congregata]|uniref:CCHC-type domain-containing protein n=1 Tax=Cotesia congregata TaxID=51543 RepID=A0A8J2HIS9_COTCN|nr:Protein of unknown function [Cotesia congregata]